MTTLVEPDGSASGLRPASYNDWRTAVERELKGVPIEKKLVTRTYEGIDVQPLYRREDVAALPLAIAPGEPPFLRGGRCPTDGLRRWEAGEDPAEYDFTPLPALALALVRVQQDTSFAAAAARSVAADPLGWLAGHGSLPMPLAECLDDLATGVTESEQAGLPARLVGVGAHRWHESGATAVQELAFALATGAAYWRHLLDRGLDPARIAPRVRLSFAVGVDLFMEIAKLRAARVVWSRMAAAFGAGTGAQQVHLVARTATWDKTLYDPHVNLLRITTQAFSAVVGGADAVDVRPFDEITGASGELGRRLSRNLHDILAEEFNLEHQIDPAGGAWYVEVLTDQLARRAWALFQDIERRGGMAAAILAGDPQQLTAKAAEEKQTAVDLRRRPILGTTVQPNLREESRHPRAAPTAAPRGKSVPKSIKSFRALLTAATKRTTLPTLRIAWTQKRDEGPSAPALKPGRAAEGFEAVRRAADDYQARVGKRAKVFLARMGPAKQHKPRADFATGFFVIGGFEIDGRKSFTAAGAAADAALESGAAIAVLCSTDDTYPELAPAFARRVKAVRASVLVVLAGHPGEREAEYRAAGFDAFIHLRSNARTTLTELQRLTGVLP
jgi:methylmalonyl-CoA mutase